MQRISRNRCFGGTQDVYQHDSRETSTAMRFSVFVPEHEAGAALPVVYWLSGLTCSEANFTEKAGAQRVAAELGLLVVVPDTSPRGDDVPDAADGAYDFGLGAGF